MLEQKIDELIAALDRVTASRGAAENGLSVAAPAETVPTRRQGGLKKPTLEMVRAAVVAVKENHGKPAAVKIINGPGKAKDLSSIRPTEYAAVLAACEELTSGDASEADPDEEDNL